MAAVSVAVAQESAEPVGHARVGITAHPAYGRSMRAARAGPRIRSTPTAQLSPTESGVDVRYRVIKRLDRLGGKRAAVGEDRSRNHHRQPGAGLLEERLDREQARLHHEGVKGGLGKQDVGAAGDEAFDLLGVVSRPSGRT